MKQLYIAFLFLLCCNFAVAQKDFRKGYIIQNADTIRGYVDYRGYNKSAQLTTFKPTLDGAEQRYTPESVAGYGFDHEKKVFEAKPVAVVDADNTVERMLFLNVLVKGKASIYYYRDSFSKDHYYLEKDTLFTELQNNKLLVVGAKSEAKFERYDKKYIGVLNYALSDCESISISQLYELRFNRSDLIRIAEKYNTCITPNAVSTAVTHREEKFKITVGPVLVYTRAALDFTGDSPLGRAEFQNTSSIGGGAFLNLTLPALNEKLSLQTELLYIPARFSAPSTDYDKFNYDILFDLAYIKLPVQLRYTYPRGVIRPYMNAGLIAGYIVKDTNRQIVSHESNFREPTESAALADNYFNHLVRGFTVGTGISYPVRDKALALELRYEQMSSIAKLLNISSGTKSFVLMLGYGF